MASYRLAGQDFSFDGLTVPELSLFGIKGTHQTALLPAPVPLALSCRTMGWVGGEQREVEVWSARNGTILKIQGGSDFFISHDGSRISRSDCVVIEEGQSDLPEVTGLDLEILLGPALVLALALRGVWCLHASAAVFGGRTFVFLGESGQGKSTLAAYLSGERKWRLVADDILPVTIGPAGMVAWPHFPQRKLSTQAQPATRLPARLPVDRICVLSPVDKSALPDLLLLLSRQAAQTLVGHTAGARLFDPSLLAAHLAFCAEAARQVLVYKLGYPHNRDTLSKVELMLEITC